MRRHWPAAMAVVAIAAMGCSPSANRQIARTTPGSPKTTTTDTTAPPANSVQAWLPIIEQFVSAHRGLAFKSPVRAVALTDAEFRKHIADATQNTAKDSADLEHAANELKALGLIAAGVDVAKAEQALLGGSVVGLYDKKDKVLYLRGTTATPYVRQVMAHELTHALQDQWFGLNRPALDNASDESGEAFLGLVEGDARRIEQDYFDTMSPADQTRATADENQIAGAVDPNIPPVLVEMLVFPYEIGPQFVQALLDAGGQARLDAAFRNPPTTTRQLLQPASYLAGQGAVAVAAPPADGPVFDNTVLGEAGILLLLGQSLSPSVARAAAAGWAGDRMVAWQSGTHLCVRDRLSGSPALGSALVTWARGGHGAGVTSTVTGSGPFLLTSCTSSLG